jgi:hypothetical protein
VRAPGKDPAVRQAGVFVKGLSESLSRGIAAAAGVTTGAIYTYFKDKNALFEAIVDPVCGRRRRS